MDDCNDRNGRSTIREISHDRPAILSIEQMTYELSDRQVKTTNLETGLGTFTRIFTLLQMIFQEINKIITAVTY